jgi:hypothetical protein
MSLTVQFHLSPDISITSIPNLAPVSPTEATVDPPSRGSRLDADHPENGVLIPCRLTTRLAGDYDDVSATVDVFGLVEIVGKPDFFAASIA